MLIVSFLQWWYNRGWLSFGYGFLEKLKSTADFFSLGLLFRTLFSPFRQISAYTDEFASIQQRLIAFTDKLVSRLVGTVVRLTIIIFGIVFMFLEAVIGSLLVLAWPLMPFAPIASIILAVLGVTLWAMHTITTADAPKKPGLARCLRKSQFDFCSGYFVLLFWA